MECFQSTNMPGFWDIEFLAWIHFNRFNDFGVDGGPVAKELTPKLDLVKAQLFFSYDVLVSGAHSLYVSLYYLETEYLKVRQAGITTVSLISGGVLLFLIKKIIGTYLVRMLFTLWLLVLFCMISTTTNLRNVILSFLDRVLAGLSTISFF
ncbi:unnamed protein product, partial [Thlaspi arvense]